MQQLSCHRDYIRMEKRCGAEKMAREAMEAYFEVPGIGPA
jgi:hypothetical protein